MIAIALLTALIVGAVWFVAHQVREHVAASNAAAPGL
jgi:hypothetical protein